MPGEVSLKLRTANLGRLFHLQIFPAAWKVQLAPARMRKPPVRFAMLCPC